MRRLNGRRFPLASGGMQFISLGVMASGTPSPPDFRLILTRLAEYAQRDEVRKLLHLYVAAFVVSQILWILWLWIASKVMVAQQSATLKNAWKVWFFDQLILIAFVAACVFGVVNYAGFAFSKQAGSAGFPAFIAAAVVLTIFGSFIVRAGIYGIGIVRIFFLNLLTGVISWVGTGLVLAVMAITFGAEARLSAVKEALGKTDAERSEFGARLLGKDAPDEIDRLLDDAAQPIGNPQPLAAREAAIQSIQQKLEARRHTLPPGDPKALAEFQPRLDRYVRLLNQVKTDRAAQLAVPKTP